LVDKVLPPRCRDAAGDRTNRGLAKRGGNGVQDIAEKEKTTTLRPSAVASSVISSRRWSFADSAVVPSANAARRMAMKFPATTASL
jgi:hypothetical protein